MTRPGPPMGDLFARAVEQTIAVTRHAGATDTDPVTDRILDAAIVVVARDGTGAATVDAIARAAEVGRATVFRRFGGKEHLLEAAVTRMVGRVIGAMVDRFTVVRDPVEQVVEGFVICMALDVHPMLARSRVHRADVLAALCIGDPAPMSLAHRAVADNLARAHRAGAITVGDPEMQADALVHLAVGYLLAPSMSVDLADPDAVRTFARRTIAPIVGYMPAPVDDPAREEATDSTVPSVAFR